MSFNRGKFGPEALARFGGILLFLVAFSSLGLAQSGPVDQTFAPTFSVTGGVRQTVIQPDGKILVTGFFTEANNVPVFSRLIRLNSNGSPDTGFQVPSNLPVWSVALLPDGKILYASGPSDSVSPKVGRLNADGSLDSSFSVNTIRIGIAYNLLVQPDGKILVSGVRAFNLTDERALNRLNADGSLDIGFNPPSTLASALINSMTLSGPRIVLSYFEIGQNQPLSQVLALNSDGSADNTFAPVNVSGVVEAQPDGKIILGGSFTSINSIPRNGIARLNGDGTVDQTFNPGTGIGAGVLTVVSLLPSGKILIGGQFVNFNGGARRNIARINADGSLDDTFNPAGGANAATISISRFSDGRLLIGGLFSSYEGVQQSGLVRTTENGTTDSGFSASLRAQAQTSRLVVQPDNKVVVAGFFNLANSLARVNIARLNPDGTTDSSFFPNAGVLGSVDALAIQTDGKILVGGFFDIVNDTPRKNLARLNADGTLDTTFLPPATNNAVFAIAAQPDGKIVVGGTFDTAGNTTRPGLLRLNADGTLDTSFAPSFDQNDGVTQSRIAVQPDGKIFLVRQQGLVRLNSDGTIDTGFSRSPSLTGPFALQSDGRVVASTFASTFEIFRLNSNGSLDASFTPPGTPSGAVLQNIRNAPGNQLVVQFIFVPPGPPETILPVARGYISRLNSDGTPDSTFAERLGLTGLILDMTVQADGRILLAGTLQSVANIGIANGTLARLNATSSSGCSFAVTPTSFTVSQAGGVSNLTVTTGTDCVWTSSGIPAWIENLPGISADTRTVQFRIRPNTGAARTATFTVAGQTVTVTQAGPGSFTPGAYRPSNGFVYLRNSNDTGFADTEFFYGATNDVPVAGDWNGDGIDTIGIFRDGQFFLRNANNTGFADLQFAFGAPGDIPIAGDWDGDGVDTVGVVRGNQVFLRNSNSVGDADIQFTFGSPGDIFIVGDWNGDGVDTIGAFRPANGFVFLRNSNSTGFADIEFFYGLAGDRPIAGDWNNDGVDTIGIVRGNQWFLRNSNSTGFADIVFTFGTDTDIPLVGDWNGLP